MDERVFEEQNDLQTLAISSDTLKSTLHEAFRAIDRGYDEIANFSTRYEHFVNIYNENKEMQVESFRDKEPEQFKVAFETYLGQEEEIDRMSVANFIRIFKLDSHDLKAQIRESPKECLRGASRFPSRLPVRQDATAERGAASRACAHRAAHERRRVRGHEDVPCGPRDADGEVPGALP